MLQFQLNQFHVLFINFNSKNTISLYFKHSIARCFLGRFQVPTVGKTYERLSMKYLKMNKKRRAF